MLLLRTRTERAIKQPLSTTRFIFAYCCTRRFLMGQTCTWNYSSIFFYGLFTGHDPSCGYLAGRVGSGQEMLDVARVGSGRIGSGRIGSGRIGSGRIGSGRIGSGRVGSDRVGSGGFQFARVASGHPGPTRPVRNDPTRDSPFFLCTNCVLLRQWFSHPLAAAYYS